MLLVHGGRVVFGSSGFLNLWPAERRSVRADAGRRVVGFGVGEDGGEFGPQEFGDAVSGAEHGRADGHRGHGELHGHLEHVHPGGEDSVVAVRGVRTRRVKLERNT